MVLDSSSTNLMKTSTASGMTFLRQTFFDSVVFQFFSKFHRITSCHYSTEPHFLLY